MGFDINWGSALYQLLAFSVLLFFLSKFALKPLLGIMEKREQMINEQISSAEKNRKDSEAFIAEQRQALEQARMEANEIIQNAKKLSEQQGQDIVKAARNDAERIKESAVAEIQREKEQAVSALREQVAGLSVLIATKVIEKELNEAEQEKLVQEYLKEVGEEL
ncbi:ATP synthase b-subunit [Alkalihalophilus pseudofirmus OF4]|uniref:ATP synthase subunit b n=1 Tax=Alkalihalophilus pseudofirmus (strain ATCC BAA-2126 / JCM 17055 / OF4) TaxID=398511 RepID=ATPF_ALKPO|nr:F0F1 ATP synthase subunit B [Alkalihalophilus pseudofirmus]P22481.3 RecName: Full=ATP synthase subunit b; AltName: Full=ATP synthase F(0) sector subunit b; AltName: Full=ATPase subunit I; AltName: Full=F-type ATPase subunit b; Short=F-ATPase subunit b [Alkalihalophilus pseudofirmus OF4]AAG48359.1 ATP synthase b subunit [Alkalihalophilus pseudofirmus OF4]ADC49432.1 ATP synthase b-subunit [Alkalihalophilus pseudofirmus OF4]